MSQQKKECWKKNLSDQVKKMIAEEKNSRAPIPQETDRLLKEILAKEAPDKWSVCKVLTELNVWKGDLEKSAKHLQEVNRKFEELLQT